MSTYPAYALKGGDIVDGREVSDTEPAPAGKLAIVFTDGTRLTVGADDEITTGAPAHRRLPDREGPMGRTIASCSCGWETETNRPQHLGRAFRSHKAAADKESTS